MSGVDSQTAPIQYGDDEKTFVTMMDDSDLKDAIRCWTAVPNTDGVFRMCVRVHDEVTPIGKNRNASKTNTTTPMESGTEKFTSDRFYNYPDNQNNCSETIRKRRLDFYKGKQIDKSEIFMSNTQPKTKRTHTANTSTITKARPTCHELHEPETLINTPIQRYLAKTEQNIEEKDQRIQEVMMVELNVKSRIERAKSNNCGEDKLHTGEVNLKQMAQNVKKLKTEKEKLIEELENKKSAAENLKDNILNKLEDSLLNADPVSYNIGGVKNWSLLRKHVFVLRKYCQTTLHGRIPPKHEILTCLEAALTSKDCTGIDISLKQRNLTTLNLKILMKKHTSQHTTVGVRSCSLDLKSNRSRSCNQSWIDRIKPTNEQDEENEQLRLALSASYAENECQHERGQYGIGSTYYSRSTLPRSKPSSTCNSTASSSAGTVQESVNINEVTCTVNDAAAALLSLRNLDSDTT
ncbi:Hypothetical predicted protein [Paramuricea clavata]|uniref:Uncharacterized protein n=1 Tax=Paramuricea clavata TaxID=317549 RepID=A0A7D9IHJ4_PARCT|nr:Hypothetical predicted protein [Paramuricea clavata]